MCQPWSAAEATKRINELACDLHCDLSITKHASLRLTQRGLITSDILFVLKSGFVYEEAEESTVKGFYKYKIESQTPNSGARFLRVVVVPDEKGCHMKIVTIMWRDEC